MNYSKHDQHILLSDLSNKSTYAVYEYLLLCRLIANLTIGLRTVATIFGNSLAEVNIIILQHASVSARFLLERIRSCCSISSISD